MRQLVGAVRDVLDVEGAVGCTPADVDGRVSTGEVRQGDHGERDRPGGLGAGPPGLGDDLAVLAADVGQAGDGDALDLTGRRRVAARGLSRTKPNWVAGTGSAPLTELGVEAGVALLHPDVVVVAALERRRLDPALTWPAGGETVAP